MQRLLLAAALAAGASPRADAQDAARDLRWTHFQLDYAAAPGEFLHVLGDAPELGAGDVTRALRMSTTDRLHWSVWVDLPRGADLSYSYVVRDGNAKRQSDPTNGALVAGPFHSRASGSPGADAKSVEVSSTAPRPLLFWRAFGSTGGFHTAELRRTGAGRRDDESRWSTGPLLLPRTSEFFVGDADGNVLSPATGVYRSSFAELWVQDDQVFAYPPNAVVEPGRLEGPFSLRSAALAEDRTVSVRLPRGYDDHPERRYPLLVLMETDLWWGSCGVFAGGIARTFDCDGETMADLVRRGVVDEFVTVAVDVTTNTCPRQRLLTPPQDVVMTASGTSGGGCPGYGIADRTASFLADELLPWLAITYRVLPDARDTFVAGFSMSAVFALYAAWERPDAFGGCGALSGAWALAPNWVAEESSEPIPPGLRVYADAGDQEGATPIFPLYVYRNTMSVVSDLMSRTRPLVVGRSLGFRTIFGAGHGPFSPEERLEGMLLVFDPRAR